MLRTGTSAPPGEQRLDLRSQRPPGFVARGWSGLLGHYSTIAPFLLRRVFPVVQPPTAPWGVGWSDREVGSVRLTGLLRALDGDELLVVVHGLGGSARSGYMPLALAAAERAGVSCLLFNVRGADLSGEDISHAGLTDDLRAVFVSPLLAAYRRIYFLGYSMGGHLALRYAAEDPDPRLQGVVAVSSPLDLAVAAEAFDRGRWSVYRRHILGSLQTIYDARYRRRGGPITPEQVRRIRRIREWDERVVAERFGFGGADDYYRRASVSGALGELQRRALYVGTAADPMVPRGTVLEALKRAPRCLDVHWARRGGHMGFASDLDLGQPGPRGLEHQVLAWLRRGPTPLG